MRHFARGYTLIEILIALTIMSLVFGIGFSGFRDYSRRQTLESLARQVRGDISIAKERALAGTKPASPNAQCDSPHSLRGHGIFAVAGGASYQLYAICTNGTSFIDTRTMPTGFTIVRTFSSGCPVVSTFFKVLGQGTSLSAGCDALFTITNTASSQSTIVTMTSSGEIR